MGLMGATLGKIQLEMGHVGHRVGPRYGGCHGHTYANCPIETQNWNSAGARSRLEFSSRMGYRPGHALYRYAHDAICPVYQQTLIDTHISTDVRCMPIEAARLAPGSELPSNHNVELVDVAMDRTALWRYPESDPNDRYAYDLDMYRYAYDRTVECACRCGDSAYASRM